MFGPANLASGVLASSDLASANLASGDLSSANLASGDLSSANLASSDLASGVLPLSGIRGRSQRTLIPKSFNNNFLDPGNDLWFCFPGSSGIPDKYFYDCILLKKLIIPNCISKIGFAAFSRCSRLKSIIIPNSVNTISDYAFSNCSALTNIVISNKINEIGESVFFGMFITYKYCNSK